MSGWLQGAWLAISERSVIMTKWLQQQINDINFNLLVVFEKVMKKHMPMIKEKKNLFSSTHVQFCELKSKNPSSQPSHLLPLMVGLQVHTPKSSHWSMTLPRASQSHNSHPAPVWKPKVLTAQERHWRSSTSPSTLGLLAVATLGRHGHWPVT